MSEHRFQQGGPGCRRACIVAMIFGISEGSVCCDHLTIFKKCTKHICSGNMSPGAAMLCALPTLSEHEHASKPAEQQQLSKKEAPAQTAATAAAAAAVAAVAAAQQSSKQQHQRQQRKLQVEVGSSQPARPKQKENGGEGPAAIAE